MRLFSIRAGDHHLIWDGKREQYFFFNVSEDPGELQDLFPSGSEIERELMARLRARVAEHDRAFAEANNRVVTETSPEVEAQPRALGYLE